MPAGEHAGWSDDARGEPKRSRPKRDQPYCFVSGDLSTSSVLGCGKEPRGVVGRALAHRMPTAPTARQMRSSRLSCPSRTPVLICSGVKGPNVSPSRVPFVPHSPESRVAVHGRRCCPAPEGGAPPSAVQLVGCARPRPPHQGRLLDGSLIPISLAVLNCCPSGEMQLHSPLSLIHI